MLSNIAVLTRLALFVETVSSFLRELLRLFPDRLERLDARLLRRYLEREGSTRGFCEGVKVGQLPDKVSADSGYFSERNLSDDGLEDADLCVPPGRHKHHHKQEPATGAAPADASPAERMRHKLRTPHGPDLYKMCKAIVEPVFGQIK